MCESCSSSGCDRRQFLATSSILGMAGLLSAGTIDKVLAAGETHKPRPKKPAKVTVAFIYPSMETVNAGKLEDPWHKHHWSTWPGNQFKQEEQHKKFAAKIKTMAKEIGIEADFYPQVVYKKSQVEEFIQKAKAQKPDAVLIVNFWNTLAEWSHRMATESAPASIVYQPVGSSHQLPKKYLRNTEGLFFIHSVENWDEIERGLRAIHAKKMLAQSRMLRVSDQVGETTEKRLGVHLLGVHADEFNATFDAVKPNDALVREAMAFKKQAAKVMDVTDEYFISAFKAHAAVNQLLERHGADAITIKCLFLKDRKPCVSFAMNNGNLVPCGCENHLDATLTMMLARWLFERGGFQHNPDFDTNENRYFASHCTSPWKLHGPKGAEQPFLVRPFFHQLPKTAAMDVQWTPKEPTILAKYHSGNDALTCWTGQVISSPTSPPVGGCATRVLVDIDDVDDVCDIHSGTHPVLFAGDRSLARRMKAFAKISRLKLTGNV